MKNKKIVVLMPFHKKFDGVYQNGIKNSVSDIECDCTRIDDQFFDETMIERIYSEIEDADLIISDMTGQNPNVYYETGYAHALGKVVILITQDTKSIPFDLKHHHHIEYNRNHKKLSEQLNEKIKHYLNLSDNKFYNKKRTREFKNLHDFYEHVVERIKVAHKIDDLSWAKPEKQERTSKDRLWYERYLKVKDEVCEKDDVAFREIFTFPSITRLKRAVKSIINNKYGYSARYYKGENEIPRFSFIIIDDVEVIIFFYSNKNRTSLTETRLAIYDPTIVDVFKDYYNNLFEQGSVLKDADDINHDELKKITERFNTSVSEILLEQ